MKSEIKNYARSFKLLLKYVKHKHKPEPEIRIFIDSSGAAQRQLPESNWWTRPKPKLITHQLNEIKGSNFQNL
jgi:hypothetical protein